MKNLFFALILMLCSKLSFAQMEDGNYTYSNKEITLNFTISDLGFTISNIVVTNTIIGKKYNGSGEWFQVNPRGVDPNYQGPFGWYQFSTDECNFDFEVPVNELILNQFDCKNGSASVKLKLTKK
jgi:hypothetical protein